MERFLGCKDNKIKVMLRRELMAERARYFSSTAGGMEGDELARGLRTAVYSGEFE
jgi:hypothetical protein